MTTLAVMKARIASEFRRDDLSADIANAITSAIDAYKYERFPFNRTAFVDAPASDGEISNAWMTTAERLIRSRAMLEVAVNVIKRSPDDPIGSFISDMQQEIADALRQLRLSQTVSGAAPTFGTLGAMKVRIANEINRGDLGPEIASAIRDAIDYWAVERYFFNEKRSATFSTTQDQDSYDVNDFNDILNVVKIDYVLCLDAAHTYTLIPCFPQRIDEAIQASGYASGLPCEFSFYEQILRFYPVPADAYDIRIAYHRAVPAPVQDSEADNVWMTTAERLIRSQAKAELYRHVEDIADNDKAMKYAALAEEAANALTRRTTKMTQIGAGRVVPYN